MSGQRFRGFVRILAAAAVMASLLVGVQAQASAAESAKIQGVVSEPDGVTHVGGVQVDLFLTADAGGRGQFLRSATTADDGTWAIDVTPGCYTFTIIAPSGRTIDGSRWFQKSLCVQADSVSGTSVLLDGAADSSISGAVTFSNGDPAQVAIDLFRGDDNEQRAEYLTTVTSGADGTYQFDVGTGCYVLTFIAPDGQTFDGSPWFQPYVCVDPDKPATGLDAVLDGGATGPSTLGGQVTDGAGGPAAGVEITRWEVGADGSRTRYLGSALTADDGRFEFAVDAGCYWLVYVAPAGETFNNSPWLERFVCVDPGQTIDDLDAMLDGGDPSVITVSIGDNSAAEGAPGETSSVDLTLTLSAPSTEDLSVIARVTGGTAVLEEDFDGTGGTVRFPAGQTSAVVTLTVLGDDVDEADETVILTLLDPSAGLTIEDGTGQLTILDDDGQTGSGPTIVDQDFSVSELSPAGTVIGTVAANGNGLAVTYSIDDTSAVSIDPSTGELRVVDPLAMVANTTITVLATATTSDGSSTATMNIAVTPINTLPNPNSAETTTGGMLEVEITGPGDRTAVPGGPLTIQGLAGIDGTTGSAAVTYVIDVSGSTSSSGNDCNGDGTVDAGDNFNPSIDSSFGTVLDCEIAGILALNRSLAGAQVQVSLIILGTSSAAADVSPADGEQVFTTPTADVNNNGVPDIEEVLVSIGGGAVNQFVRKTVGGSTNFDRALTTAATVIGQRDAGLSGFVFFLSDGRSIARAPAIQALADDGVQVNTYSVGASGTGCDESDALRVISDGTGGDCTEVDDPGALTAALTSAPQNLDSVTISIDGGPGIDAQFNALGQWSVEVPEVSTDRHIIRATVRASDGTEVAAEILVIRLN